MSIHKRLLENPPTPARGRLLVELLPVEEPPRPASPLGAVPAREDELIWARVVKTGIIDADVKEADEVLVSSKEALPIPESDYHLVLETAVVAIRSGEPPPSLFSADRFVLEDPDLMAADLRATETMVLPAWKAQRWARANPGVQFHEYRPNDEGMRNFYISGKSDEAAWSNPDLEFELPLAISWRPAVYVYSPVAACAVRKIFWFVSDTETHNRDVLLTHRAQEHFVNCLNALVAFLRVITGGPVVSSPAEFAYPPLTQLVDLRLEALHNRERKHLTSVGMLRADQEGRPLLGQDRRFYRFVKTHWEQCQCEISEEWALVTLPMGFLVHVPEPENA